MRADPFADTVSEQQQLLRSSQEIFRLRHGLPLRINQATLRSQAWARGPIGIRRTGPQAAAPAARCFHAAQLTIGGWPLILGTSFVSPLSLVPSAACSPPTPGFPSAPMVPLQPAESKHGRIVPN